MKSSKLNKKKIQSSASVVRPVLKLLVDLPVLGNRYRFGQGQAWDGTPVLYLSSTGYGRGISITSENVAAYQQALNQAVSTFLGQATSTATAAPTAPSIPNPCPGPENPLWVKYQRLTMHPSSRRLDQHSLQPDKFGACAVCGYRPSDSAWIAEMETTAKDLYEP